EGLQIGDVVVADTLAYHDVDLTAFGYDYGQMSMQPLYFESDKTFVETFEQVLSEADVSSHIGLIATGDSFIAGQDKIDAIKSVFPQVLAVEMEGAAIAQRSEEHTSELQSRFDLVCRLLLEKKNIKLCSQV